MDLTKRRRAITDVVLRLEERSLRQQKRDEQDRFAGAAEEPTEEDRQVAVAVNERLKLNYESRPGLRSRN